MGSGRRAGQRFDAEHGVATEALVFLGDLDPDAVGAGIEYATHYEATPVADFERLIAALPPSPEGRTFVDIGSGMGRAVFLAARSPFRAIVGVEISPALHEIARENFAAFPKEGLACRDVRFVRADAGDWPLPPGDLVLYLYNPFGATVLDRLLDRVLALDPAIDVVLIYHTPVESASIEARHAFTACADLGFGRIYRREN